MPFLTDPDRYYVAMVKALVISNSIGTGKAYSDRKAARFIAAMQVGRELEIPPEIRAGCPAGFLPVFWGPTSPPTSEGTYVNTKRGASASTIEGRAATFRQKIRRIRSDRASIAWLENMSSVFLLASNPDIYREIARRGGYINLPEEGYTLAAKGAALQLAESVGEGDVARRLILPMIEYAAGGKPPPDFPTYFSIQAK